MTAQSSSAAQSRLFDLAPALTAAVAFSLSDVFSKITFMDGMDVLSLSTFRSVFTLVFMFVWLRAVPAPGALSGRQRWISYGLGVLFAGIVFGLFKSIELVEVPVAILTYFVYPLLTGIVGSMIGIDRMSWRGAIAAVVAFGGLALMVGAHPAQIAVAGIAFALGAACLRTGVLLITRATLQGADTRLVTWHFTASSTAILAAVSLVTWNWHWPHSAYGWFGLIVVSVTVTIAVLTLFVSIERVGAFRTALIMNLEPLLATLLSAPLLGEVITPLQGLGGAVMLAALVAFQIRR